MTSCSVWQPSKTGQKLPATEYSMMNLNFSYQNSAAFIKSLTHAALSTIVYQRGILNDQCFDDTHLFGAEVKLLKEESGLRHANFVTSSLRSAFDAFDRKHLDRMVFSVFEDAEVRRPDSRVESYSFQFNYHGSSTNVSLQGQGNTSSSSSADDLQRLHDMSNDMIQRAYESARSEPPLPPKFSLQFQISFNKSKPAEYYVPRYMGIQYKIRRQDYKDDDALLASLGQLASVSTRSHSLVMKKYSAAAPMTGSQPLLEANRVDVRRRLSQSQGMSGSQPLLEANRVDVRRRLSQSQGMSGSQPLLEANRVDVRRRLSQSQGMSGSQPLLEANRVDVRRRLSQSQVLPVEPMTGREEGREHELSPRELYCLCGADAFGDDVITSHCIKCTYCRLLQHAICYNWNDKANATYHCCLQCALKEPKRVCTNPILLLRDTNTIKAVCVLRLTVEWCTFAGSVTARLLARSFNMTNGDLKKLISKMEHYGILQPLTSAAHDTMDAERPVNNDAAKELIKRYLSPMQTLQTSSQDSSSELDSRQHRRRLEPTLPPPVQLVYQKEIGENSNPFLMFQRSDSPILKPMTHRLVVKTCHQNKALGQKPKNRKDPTCVFEFNGDEVDREIEEPNLTPPVQLVYKKETGDNTNPFLMFQRSDSPILKPMTQVKTCHQNKALGQKPKNKKDPASVFEFNSEVEDTEMMEPWRIGWDNRMRTQQLNAEKRKAVAAASCCKRMR